MFLQLASDLGLTVLGTCPGPSRLPLLARTLAAHPTKSGEWFTSLVRWLAS